MKFILSWLEESIEEVNNKMLTHSQVSRDFATYEQYFHCEYNSSLNRYLEKYADNGVYKSLLSNQRSLELHYDLWTLLNFENNA